MTDPNERDDLFRNRITDALRHLNGFHSEAAIEAELEALDASPMDDASVERIMTQVQTAIRTGQPPGGSPSGITRPTRNVADSPDSTDGDTAMRKRPVINAAVRHNLPSGRTRKPGASSVVAMAATFLCLLTAFGLFQSSDTEPVDQAKDERQPNKATRLAALPGFRHQFHYGPKMRPEAPAPQHVQIGETIRTAKRERRRVILPDGSLLYLNEQTTAAVTTQRTVALHRGEVFVEVTPADVSGLGPFVVETPDRSITALGTKFAVSTGDASSGSSKTDVLVTQGKVRVSGTDDILTSGQVAAAAAPAEDVVIGAAPRASQALSWTRELMAAAETPLVPDSDHRGGSITVVDPDGQEMRLSLRKFHVDAYIEDGFARTTIDQTYFNHTHSRQEGTFHFPLPPDASLSRLAMYVNGKLMEGGMVERNHGRNVFEQIMHTKRDPALLEWVDGSTFKMRVFPLEPRQEKRIVLSYTQRLPNDYDRTVYRFPAGHNLERVRDWSSRVTIDDGAGSTRWYSPSHLLKPSDVEGDLILEGELHNATLEKDLIVELTPAAGEQRTLASEVSESVKFSTAIHEGYRYLMLRYRPDLSGDIERPQRNWIFLYESSGDRNPLLARTQLDIISTLLEHAEHDDTFSIVQAATRTESFRTKPVRCSKKNIANAVSFLEDSHLVGALDLEEALTATHRFHRSGIENFLVHVGSATPVIGQRSEKQLLKKLPSDTQYVGVGVGKRWSQTFMKSAASRSGGHFTQINPDEKVGWRAFELLSTLNAPRLLNIQVDSGRKKAPFLTFADTIAHGQEIAAVTRLPIDAKGLESVTVSGTVDGQPFNKTLNIDDVAPNAGYLPRTWTRREIDRLVSAGSESHKEKIIALSKAMYVMSPFTSLLVLEDEAMYTQFNVDRGRKDHWALYAAPQKIPVVHEPSPQLPKKTDPVKSIRKQLKTQRARRDLASATLDLGRRDNRTPDQIAKLQARLDDEQQLVDRLENRLKLAEQVEGDKVTKIVKSVLFRKAGPFTQVAQYVNSNVAHAWPYAFGDLGWAQNDLSFGRGGDVIVPAGVPQHHWAFQPALPTYQFDYGLYGEGLIDPQAFGAFERSRRVRTIRGVDGVWNGTFTGEDFILWDVDGEINGEFPVDSFILPQGLGLPGIVQQNSQGLTFTATGGIQLRGFDRQQIARPRFVVDFDQNGNGILDLTDEVLLEPRWAVAPMDEVLSSNQVQLLAIRPDISQLNAGFALPVEGLNWNNSRLSGLVLTTDSSLSPNGLPTDLSDFGFVPAPTVTRLALPGLEEARANMRWGINVSGIEDLRSIPVAPYYSMWMEDQNGDVDRYGKIPVLDGYTYWSDDAGLTDRDDILQFGTYQLNPYGWGPGYDTELGYRTLSPIRWYKHFEDPNHLMWRGKGISSPRYVVQVVPQHLGVLKNILTYASGMQSMRADLLATLEAETDDEGKPKRGTVDANARKLIERSRARDWEQFELSSDGDVAAVKLMCNGAGELRIERRTRAGLTERIASDGSTLWHLYSELGVGAKRPVSRFHRRVLQRLTPWIVLPDEDLAIGSDVRMAGPNTIRITALRSEATNDDENATNSEKTREIALELVFDDEARLIERRVVTLPDNKVLVRHVFEPSGSIRILNAEGEELVHSEIARTAVDAPSDQPNTDGLVVLPLPYRSADSYSLTVPAESTADGKTDYSKLSDNDAMKLVATHLAGNQLDEIWNVFKQRFGDRDDFRMGFATLLASCMTNNSQPVHEIASHNQGSSALGSFLVQYCDWIRDRDINKEFVLPDSASPFLEHLANIHNHYALWASKRATQDRTESQVLKELTRTIEFVHGCPSQATGWTLLKVAHKSIAETHSSKKLFARLVTEAAKFEDVPGLAAEARLARIQWLLSAGGKKKASQLYREFLSRFAKAGLPPQLSAQMHDQFVTSFGDSEEWIQSVVQAGLVLASKDRSRAIMSLARSCAALSETDTANDLLQLAISDVDLDSRPDLLLSGLGCLTGIGEWSQADDFIRRLMRREQAASHAALWRTASQIAAELGDQDESLRRLQQAMRIEFAHLPDTVNLESLRKSYGELFDRFTVFAEETMAKEKRLPEDFVSRLTEAGDAWRSVDPDPTQSCQRVARLLQSIGLHDQAWDYWTTPLVQTANSSSAWQSLATALQGTGQLQLASQAWTEAFNAESTNPELLWKHSEMLRSNGRSDQAKPLLQQIVNGQWQPRFNGVKSKARSTLQSL